MICNCGDTGIYYCTSDQGDQVKICRACWYQMVGESDETWNCKKVE